MTDSNSPELAEKALWGGYSRTGSPSAVHDCYYQCASNDPKIPQLWGYMDDLSYAPSSMAQLHVSTTATTFDILIYRDGAKRQVVFQKQELTGAFQQTPTDCSVNGCGWPVTLEISIGSDWASGAYVVELTAIDGSLLEYDHVFLVRPG